MNYDFDTFEVNESRITLNKDEEIKKLTLDEDLSEIKRAQIILMRGQQRQKQAIYNNLHKLLPIGFDQLFQYIRGDIMEQSEEIQIIAARSLKDVKVKPKEIIQLALHFIQLYQQKLAQAWMPVFQNLVLLIDYKEYQSYLEKMIIQFSDPKQPEIGRWVGAKLIICIAPILKDEIKGPILDRVRILCCDSDIEIRELVADELLSCLMCTLSADLLDQYFTDKINELLYDSQIRVKKSMIKTFLRFQHKLPRNDYNKRSLAIFLDCLSTNNIELLSVAVQYSGETFTQIQEKDEEFNNKFATIYSKLGQHQNEEIRKWYLYNLPGIILQLHEGPYANLVLMPYADILLQDKCHKNKMLACKILHEVSKQFDYSYVLQKMWHLFECVIQTDDIDCILAINIPQMYKLLQGNEENQEKLKTQFTDINQQFNKIYEKCLTNFKYNLQFLEYLYEFVDLIHKKHFEQFILPAIYKDQRNIECDMLSMKCLTKFFCTCKDYEIQTKIKDTMNLMFFRGNNNKRVRYIFWVSNLSQQISKRRFQELNLNQVTTFISDRVASVQIQIIKILPNIYYYLDPLEYNLIKNVKGVTQQNMAQKVLQQISQMQQNKNFEQQQEEMQKQEEQIYSQYILKQKTDKNNEQAGQQDFANKYLKKPIPKLVSQQSKKTPSASTSVRLTNQSFGELTPQYQQQQQIARVRRYTDATKSNVKPQSRPSGFTQK